jgi:AAA ATPase domain
VSLEKATALVGEPVHRTILALDIEGSTRPGRRDVDRLRMRAALYHLLERCLRRAGVQPAEYQRSDQGDGVLVLLSPEIPKTRVLPGLILRLAAGLDRYNRSASAASRLRLRAVMHAGEIASDAHGHASKDLNLTFRLLDSDLLRDCLANAPTSLVLLVSDSIHSDIVAQGYGGIDPEAFQPVQVARKNIRARARLYLPGRNNAIAADRLREPAEAPPAVPRRTVPHELPPDTPDFTGRERELHELLLAFGRDDAGPPTVVVIHGVGGVGKSALAVHAAHRLAAGFPDGQLYVNLQGATVGLWPLDPAEVVGRLLRGLGVDGGDIPVDVEEAAARFRSLVADRRILLVLDNAVSAAQVKPLLPASRNSAALITSRSALTTLGGATHLHLDGAPSRGGEPASGHAGRRRPARRGAACRRRGGPPLRLPAAGPAHRGRAPGRCARWPSGSATSAPAWTSWSLRSWRSAPVSRSATRR